MTPHEMEQRLLKAYPEARIEVTDLTGTQDHYQVSIVSAKFADMTRIAAHKAVMAVFDNELKSGEVHALTIRTAAG